MKENNADLQNGKHCLQGDVNGSITISNRKGKYQQKEITSKSNFFSTDIIVKYKDGKFTFRKLMIHDVCKFIKPVKTKEGFYHISIYGEEIPTGKFDFDVDETTEDYVVVYCR